MLLTPTGLFLQNGTFIRPSLPSRPHLPLLLLPRSPPHRRFAASMGNDKPPLHPWGHILPPPPPPPPPPSVSASISSSAASRFPSFSFLSFARITRVRVLSTISSCSVLVLLTVCSMNYRVFTSCSVLAVGLTSLGLGFSMCSTNYRVLNVQNICL